MRFVLIPGAGCTADFMRRVTRERLGFAPDEVPGAHFPMLGHPLVLADYLTS